MTVSQVCLKQLYFRVLDKRQKNRERVSLEAKIMTCERVQFMPSQPTGSLKLESSMEIVMLNRSLLTSQTNQWWEWGKECKEMK